MSNNNPVDRYRDPHARPPSIAEKAHAIMMGEAGPSAPRRFEHVNRQPRMAVDTMFGGGEYLSEYADSTASVSPSGNRRNTYSEDVRLVEAKNGDGVEVKVPIFRGLRRGASNRQRAQSQSQNQGQGLFRATELGSADDAEMVERADGVVQPQQQDEPSGRTKRHISRLSATMSNFGRNMRRKISFWDKKASQDSGYRSDDENCATDSKGRYSAASAQLDTALPSPIDKRDDGGPIEPHHTAATARPSTAGQHVRRSTQGQAAPKDEPVVALGTETPRDFRPRLSVGEVVSRAQYGREITRSLRLALQHGRFDHQHLDRRMGQADGNATTPEKQSKASQTLKLEIEATQRRTERDLERIEKERDRGERTRSAPAGIRRMSLQFFKRRSGTMS